MVYPKPIHTLLAAALAALAMTGQVIAIAPGDTARKADSGTEQNSATEQDRLPASKDATSTSTDSQAVTGANPPPEQDRLPASKEGASTTSTQAITGASPGTNSESESQTISPAQGNGAEASKSNPEKHPPTSVMDSATPTQNAPDEPSSAKHPPTGIMDTATPKEKSPGTSTSESQTGNQPTGTSQ